MALLTANRRELGWERESARVEGLQVTSCLPLSFPACYGCSGMLVKESENHRDISTDLALAICTLSNFYSSEQTAQQGRNKMYDIFKKQLYLSFLEQSKGRYNVFL